MKVITKNFDSESKAVRFRETLYDKWHSVVLVRSPMFGESGIYQWRVATADECRDRASAS